MQFAKIIVLEIFVSLCQNSDLIKASVRRDVLARYRGSILGLFWSFLNPLLMLLIFTFVFSVIFQARWGEASASKVEFGLILFIGLIMFNLFSETLQRAPDLITANTNYVKKVVFPLEILPLVSVLSAIFHASISLVAWLLVYAVFVGTPQVSAFYLPLILLPVCVFLFGFSLFLAALGVYLRDVSQIIGPMMTALLFLSPVFYPVTSFPEEYRFILYLNPLTVIVEQARDILFWGKIPNVLKLGSFWIFSLIVGLLGFVWFKKVRNGFADVL